MFSSLRAGCRGIPAALIVLAVLAAIPAVAQDKTTNEKEPRPEIPVKQWLAGPERKDFKWSVDLDSPRLTLQQRHIVKVRANVDAESLTGSDHDLYFVLKVADDDGNWLPEDSYNHFLVRADIDRKNEIEYIAGFYARPGKYTVALVLFDVASRKGNVWRKQFEVKEPKNDPLPELDRDLPRVEFVNEVPPDTTRQKVSLTPGRRPLWRNPSPIAAQWPLGHGIEYLPVQKAKSMRVDVVLNVAPWIDPNMQRGTPAASYRTGSMRVLEVGAVLSHLGIQDGCVHVSAVDLSKLEVVFDRVDGKTADWDALSEQVRNRDHDTISVSVLSNRKATGGFLRDFMTTVMTDQTGCGSGATAERAIILVSNDFSFPSGTHGDHLWPDVQCACHYYHVRITGVFSPGDDLATFLKPVEPRRFDIDTPEHFRKSLAELIDDLPRPAPAPSRERAQ